MMYEEKNGKYGSEENHQQEEGKSPFAPEPASKRKVERTDGLPTVDDLAKLMGQEECECEGQGCEMCGHETEGQKVGNMVEIILKIK